MDARFRERYGPWALVAGASEGLGAEFAQQLAAAGLNVALVARREGPLHALAEALHTKHHVEARALPLDLTRPEHLTEITDVTAGLDVGLVVCNAALSPIGHFLERTIEDHQALLDLNCRAPMFLAHHFGRRLVGRGRGGLVVMSSLAGLQGTALTVHYAASKAYLRVLAEGLWEELRPHGVDVLTCVAGPTETPTWSASGAKRSRLLRLPPVQRAEDVVSAALDGLGRTPMVTPGVANSAIGFLVRRLMPTSLAVRLVSNTTRKMYQR